MASRHVARDKGQKNKEKNCACHTPSKVGDMYLFRPTSYALKMTVIKKIQMHLNNGDVFEESMEDACSCICFVLG